MNAIKQKFRQRLSMDFDISFGKRTIRQFVLIFLSFILLSLNTKAQKKIDTIAIVNSIFPPVAPDIEKGEVTWLQKVTEEEYRAVK